MSSNELSARRRRTRELVLAALSEHAALTRLELSRLTGLSRSAVGACVASLSAEGLVDESRRRSASGIQGRPSMLVSLGAPDGVVVGIDFGHAHVTAAVATRTGRVLAERTSELDVDQRPTEAFDTAARLTTDALDDAGHTIDDVRGVAAGIPGPLDLGTTVVRSPTILTSWVGRDPAAELARRLDRRVVVANDADMGAVGEQTYGAASGIDDFLYVKVSHGIGAALVLGGRVYRGSLGIAGEIGHTQIPGATSWCRCGSSGCLETVVSSTEVRRKLSHVLTAERDHQVPDSRALADLVVDPSAARVVIDAGRTIGRVLADLVNCLNPAAIVLGGELGAAGEALVTGVRESVDRYAQPASAQAVTVLPAALGFRSELHGALATAIRAAAPLPAATPIARIVDG